VGNHVKEAGSAAERAREPPIARFPFDGASIDPAVQSIEPSENYANDHHYPGRRLGPCRQAARLGGAGAATPFLHSPTRPGKRR